MKVDEESDSKDCREDIIETATPLELVSSMSLLEEYTLYTKDGLLEVGFDEFELLTKVQNTSNDIESIYYHLPTTKKALPTAHTPKRLRPNHTSTITTTNNHKIITQLKDRLRRLKRVQKDYTENADLEILIGKWRVAVNDVLNDLKKWVPPGTRSSEILNTLGMDWNHLDLDISEDSDSSDLDDEFDSDSDQEHKDEGLKKDYKFEIEE